MNYRNFFKIFSVGAIGYSFIEIVWRRYTHWSMALTGGFCFSALFNLYSKMSNKVSLKNKCICGSIIITASEFISGVLFNKILKYNIWDYSNKKLNIAGQICPTFSFYWLILCLPVTQICDYINKNLELTWHFCYNDYGVVKWIQQTLAKKSDNYA